jgi:hypothetical protein
MDSTRLVVGRCLWGLLKGIDFGGCSTALSFILHLFNPVNPLEDLNDDTDYTNHAEALQNVVYHNKSSLFLDVAPHPLDSGEAVMKLT